MKQLDLEELRAADVALCDKEKLVDLRELEKNRGDSKEKKVLAFLECVRNPYLFRVGDIAVKVDYCGEKSLSDLMVNTLKAG